MTLDTISNPPFIYMGKYEAIWTKDLVVFQMSVRGLLHTATDRLKKNLFTDTRLSLRFQVVGQIQQVARQGIKQLGNSFGSVSSIFQ